MLYFKSSKDHICCFYTKYSKTQVLLHYIDLCRLLAALMMDIFSVTETKIAQIKTFKQVIVCFLSFFLHLVSAENYIF